MNILILDDEPIAIAVLKRHVSKLGDCAPVAFTRPGDSLAWCIVNEPDMVIVDYVMPEMDGIEFTRRFRLLPGKSEIPVLMVTADNDRDLRHRALAMGINDFLTKPVDAVELNARMRNMLALRASQKHLAHRAQLLAAEAAKSAAAALEVASRERETLLCLGLAAERRDPETHEHITRMSHYSELIGRRMGFSEADSELLLLASPLHDVGKLGTPDHILLKRGKLTDDEFLIMKQHTVIGAEILSQSRSPILQAGAQIAMSHHEKFDGSGYPNGLKGEAIPHFGRIVAVADVFDALTSARPYKKAWELERALGFMREKSGSHFDPACTDAFFDVLDDVLKIRAQHQDADMRDSVTPPSAAARVDVVAAAA